MKSTRIEEHWIYTYSSEARKKDKNISSLEKSLVRPLSNLEMPSSIAQKLRMHQTKAIMQKISYVDLELTVFY
jgi:hypothetical protein